MKEGQRKGFNISVFAPRPDGLVFSTDGVNIKIVKGLDLELEARAAIQAYAPKPVQITVITRPETVETTLFVDNKNTQFVKNRLFLLRQLREIPGMGAI